jgi:hypothetical protein
MANRNYEAEYKLLSFKIHFSSTFSHTELLMNSKLSAYNALYIEVYLFISVNGFWIDTDEITSITFKGILMLLRSRISPD